MSDYVLRAPPEKIGVLIECAWWGRAIRAQRARRGGERP